MPVYENHEIIEAKCPFSRSFNTTMTMFGLTKAIANQYFELNSLFYVKENILTYFLK